MLRLSLDAILVCYPVVKVVKVVSGQYLDKSWKVDCFSSTLKDLNWPILTLALYRKAVRIVINGGNN